jgi:hypothetical protein
MAVHSTGHKHDEMREVTKKNFITEDQ